MPQFFAAGGRGDGSGVRPSTEEALNAEHGDSVAVIKAQRDRRLRPQRGIEERRDPGRAFRSRCEAVEWRS